MTRQREKGLAVQILRCFGWATSRLFIYGSGYFQVADQRETNCLVVQQEKSLGRDGAYPGLSQRLREGQWHGATLPVCHTSVQRALMLGAGGRRKHLC